MAELMTALPEPLFSDPATIRFAIDQRSTFLTDIKNNSVRVAVELLEGVLTKLAYFDIDIYSVTEAMFYGSRIVNEPENEKTYDKRAAEKPDGQVFESMKKA